MKVRVSVCVGENGRQTADEEQQTRDEDVIAKGRFMREVNRREDAKDEAEKRSTSLHQISLAKKDDHFHVAQYKIKNKHYTLEGKNHHHLHFFISSKKKDNS